MIGLADLLQTGVVVGPLAFSQLESLFGLAQRGVDVKPTLLRVLTDLYTQSPAHTPEEERQYVELALRLVDTVDIATRDAVARKLADYPAAPRAILKRLAESTAGGVPSPHPARAVPSPVPSNASDARSPDTDAADFTELFFGADAVTRKSILDSFGEVAIKPASPVDCGSEMIEQLERAVLAGRPGDFVRGLERTLDISRTLAERIVNDPSGEPLVIAAKALAMPLDVLQRILLFVNPAIGHSVKRVYDLSALYGEIGAETATHFIALWRTAQPVTRGPGHAARASAHDQHDRSAPRETPTMQSKAGPAQAQLDGPRRQRTS